MRFYKVGNVSPFTCPGYLRDVADVAKAAFLCYALGVLGTLGYCVARLEKRGVVPRSRQTTAADVFSLFATLLYASEAGAGYTGGSTKVASTWVVSTGTHLSNVAPLR